MSPTVESTPPSASKSSLTASAASVPSGSSSTSSPVPSSDALLTTRFLGHSCALDGAGLAWCWRHPLDELAPAPAPAPAPATTPAPATDLTPRRVPQLDGATDVANTGYFFYILRANGEVYLWGKHRHSYLGDVTTPRLLPAPKHVRQLGSSGSFVTLLNDSGEAWACIDSFASPDPGEPGNVVSQRPELLLTKVASLSAPGGTAFVDAAGRALEQQGPDWNPVRGLEKVRAISDGTVTSCTLLERSIECWGSTGRGERFSLTPPAAVASIGISVSDVYALGTDGRVWVSLALATPRLLVPVGGITDAVELAHGGSGTLDRPYCLRFRDQSLRCWAAGERRHVGGGSWPANPELAVMRKNIDASYPVGALPP